MKLGRIWKGKRAELSDWMFLRADKVYGNYTPRPPLKTMKPQEAEVWRSRFAEP
ncbi:MAG: DUF2314 domain-containing protein [Verrucomicrobia bacterium]|nr:DUF2314 domain-containing protein [Verrucomicrobiota bacterium]